MKIKYIVYSIIAVALTGLAISCSGISFNKVTNAIFNPSARQAYAKEFKGQEALFAAWDNAYNSAVSDSLSVSLPYGERGTFNPAEPLVYSYNCNLQEGEMLLTNVDKDSLDRVFIDVYEQRDSIFKKIESNEMKDPSLIFAAKRSGTYKVIVQPEIAADSDFFISLNKKPLYNVFPVAGKGNAAVGSFWGVDRDGGKRRHEGIDIFAKKGTPVVAVTDGFVTYTGEKGIGGKQVWLRDNDFGSSLYYAHLDVIKAETGSRVRAGDTLGFVGNTGNARFTPAHLHFGIYRNYGAVNPLPFVHENDMISMKGFTKSFKNSTLKIKGNTANLRQQPDTKGLKIGELKANDAVTLLGQSKEWLHVRTALGTKAFLHKTLVKEVL